MEERLLIGIDGGGTHSTAVAASPEGRVVAVVYGEGLNFHNIGLPRPSRRMHRAISRRRTCGRSSTASMPPASLRRRWRSLPGMC